MAWTSSVRALNVDLHHGCLVALLLTFACKKPVAKNTSVSKPQATSFIVEPPSKTPPSTTPLGFDFRQAILDPNAINRTELCHISILAEEETADADAQAQGLPLHRLVQCASATTDAWVDLHFTSTQSPAIATLKRGHVAQVQILASSGGKAAYPIVRWINMNGFQPLGSRPSLSRTYGFNFGTLTEDLSLLGSTQPCSLAYVGHLQAVPPFMRQRLSYPHEVGFRTTVQCRAQSPSADEPALVWVDLVIFKMNGMKGLDVVVGKTLDVQIHARRGGFAEYPVVVYPADAQAAIPAKF